MDDAAAAAASDVATSSTNRPRSYLIIHNIGKKHNIGTIVRSAVAFGVTQVCLVGSKRYNAFGSHGSVDYMDLRHFDTLALARNYLKDECGCTIVGVEIAEGAAPIHKHPFSGSCAFMLGNEGQGLSRPQMDACDAFVYIGQYGTGTASLNVAVAASIVLHHFALWADFDEAARDGYKFVLTPRPQRTRPRGQCDQGDPAQVREGRAARRSDQAQWLDVGDASGALTGIFEDGA